MSQVITDKTQKPLSNKDQIRPFDKVRIKWPVSKHTKVEYEEEVHPLFAVKMAELLKAEFVDDQEEKKWTALYGESATEKAKKTSKKEVNDK